jgi:hypothetical protein
MLLQELVTIFFAYNAVQVVLSFSIFVGAQWTHCTCTSPVTAARLLHSEQWELLNMMRLYPERPCCCCRYGNRCGHTVCADELLHHCWQCSLLAWTCSSAAVANCIANCRFAGEPAGLTGFEQAAASEHKGSVKLVITCTHRTQGRPLIQILLCYLQL